MSDEQLKTWDNLKIVIDERCRVPEDANLCVGDIVYGNILSPDNDDEVRDYMDKGFYVVEDAVTLDMYLVPHDGDIAVIDMEMGTYDRENERFVDADEYRMYVDDRFEEASSISKSLSKDKLCVGHMFRIQVADGYAFYVVTDIHNDGTCDVEYRKFCSDKWTDHYFGYGRQGVPVEDVWGYINREIKMRELFSG